MFYVLVTAIFIASGGEAQIEEEFCDAKTQLQVCIDKTPRTRVGLPRTRQELDAHCSAYNIGMSCMDAWMQRCLPTDSHKIMERQLGGARMVMKFLCSNESSIRRAFLKESTCWTLVSSAWTNCIDEMHGAMNDISDKVSISDYQRNTELCCARDDFISCVTHATRSCSASASKLLVRLAWVLAQDAVKCTEQVQCSAEGIISAPLLTILSSIVLYPHN